MFLNQKVLELAMRLSRSKYRVVRGIGEIAAIIPVWYSERMERKLFEGTWDPGKKYRKTRKKSKKS